MKIKIFFVMLVWNVEQSYSISTDLIAPIHIVSKSETKLNQISHQPPKPNVTPIIHSEDTPKQTIKKSNSDEKIAKKNIETVKSDTPKVIKPKTVKPKIVPKVVTPKIVQAKVVQPKVVQPKIVIPKSVVKPVVTNSTTKTMVKSTQSNLGYQIFNQFFIVNNGQFPVELNGFIFNYTDPQGALVEPHYILDKPHMLQSEKQNKDIRAHVYSIEVPLPGGSKLHGLSALLIKNKSVSVAYHGIPWTPSAASTNVLYITSNDGKIWKLDEKAMKAEYEYTEIMQNVDQNPKKVNSSDGISNVINTAEAVVASSLLHHEMKNQKKLKKSKSMERIMNQPD